MLERAGELTTGGGARARGRGGSQCSGRWSLWGRCRARRAIGWWWSRGKSFSPAMLQRRILCSARKQAGRRLRGLTETGESRTARRGVRPGARGPLLARRCEQTAARVSAQRTPPRDRPAGMAWDGLGRAGACWGGAGMGWGAGLAGALERWGTGAVGQVVCAGCEMERWSAAAFCCLLLLLRRDGASSQRPARCWCCRRLHPRHRRGGWWWWQWWGQHAV